MVPEPSAARSPKPLILVAEDDQDYCEVLSLWLNESYQILVACDGDDALSIAHRCLPDAALVDVMMPRLSGYGLIWAFRHHPRLVNIPVVLITAHPDTAGSAPSGDPLLLKPFERPQLEKILRALLARRRDEPPVTRPPFVGAEHRRTERAAVRLPAVLQGAQSIPGTVVSISLLGAFFATDAALRVGGSFVLSFEAEGAPYRIPVEVIHTMDRHGIAGVGLCLRDLGLDQEKRLEDLLEGLLPSAAPGAK